MGHLQTRVAPNNSIPKNWGEFFMLADDKKELFAFLSSEVQTDKEVISTLLEDVVCRRERDKEGLSPCSHEEADIWMMVHVADAEKQYNYELWTVTLLS